MASLLPATLGGLWSSEQRVPLVPEPGWPGVSVPFTIPQAQLVWDPCSALEMELCSFWLHWTSLAGNEQACNGFAAPYCAWQDLKFLASKHHWFQILGSQG